MSKNGGLDEHEAAYIGAFAGEYRSESRLAKAYEVALDIRKFEIDLYWKRSASFWLLVGGISAMLGFLVSGKSGAGNPLLSPRLTEVAWRVQF